MGSVGSDFAKSYTVIGDNVNLAARLEAANKVYGTKILICKEVWDVVKDEVECRELDYICVAGKTQPIHIFSLMALKGLLSETTLALKNHFEEGLLAYRKSEWDTASQAFNECLLLDDNDQPSKVFLSRIELFKLTPPKVDWDGAWTYS